MGKSGGHIPEKDIPKPDRPDNEIEWNPKWGAWPGEWPERMVIWDLETTGLHHSPKEGEPHRIVDIAAIEVINGEITGRYQQYANPERDVPFYAQRVHGLTEKFLKNFPTFSEIGEDFLKFINTDSRTNRKASKENSYIIAHNDRFDLPFMNAELERAGMDTIAEERSIDSLAYARKIRPDLENHDLDTLAYDYGLDISDREHTHRALSCSEILTGVQMNLLQKARQEGKETFPNVPFTVQSPVAMEESGVDAQAALQKAHLEAHGDAPVMTLADLSHTQRLAADRRVNQQQSHDRALS